MSKTVLAFDFGASSGRAMLARLENGKITMEEIHRFSNDPVTVGGTMYWDILRLFFEIKQGITKAVNHGGFDAIGIDTWGVDFGLIDRDGNLIDNPVHYRDTRTEHMMDEAFEIVPKEKIYGDTGIQFMAFNTLYQLYYLKKYRPEVLSRADKFLLIPDLFNYFLTGEKSAEYTEVSTTQMLNPETGDWAFEVIDALGLPRSLFCDIKDPGTVYGKLSDSICEELGTKKVPVINVASHDTGSAVVAVPANKGEKFVYISCGTWSLFGIESDKPIITELSEKYNITNEGGYGRTTRFLKNIMGLWLIQESRRQWIREGEEVTFNMLEKEALSCHAFACFIDPDAPDFVAPGNLPQRVRDFCKRTGQNVPATRGEVMRCIYESLAMKYRYTLDCVEKTTGNKYSSINMIGGGTKDRLLCGLTANSTGLEVVAGPIEATVLGNIAVQFMALGEISDIWEARKIIGDSFDPIHYVPDDRTGWDDAYAVFKRVLGLEG